MKIFLSDLHLGDGGKSDDFSRDEELLNLFAKYSYGPNEIILLGDVYELWQAHLSGIMWEHNLVCDSIINNPRIKPIFGNHCFLPFEKYWPEIYEDDLIFAQHGHQHDTFNRYKNPLLSLKWPIGKYITIVIGGLERFLHRDIDVWAGKMKERYGEFLWEAAKLQSAKKFNGHFFSGKKITIEGHSHKSVLYKHSENGKIYGNAGAWTNNIKPTYIQVNDNTVQLRDGLDYEVIEEVKID